MLVVLIICLLGGGGNWSAFMPLSPPCGHSWSCWTVFCLIELKFVSLLLGISRGLWGERTTWTRWRASMLHTQLLANLKTSASTFTHTNTQREGEGFTPTHSSPDGLAVLQVKICLSSMFCFCFVWSRCSNVFSFILCLLTVVNNLTWHPFAKTHKTKWRTVLYFQPFSTHYCKISHYHT